MAKKPELKQFGDLTVEDFARHPVWISCHTEDCDEPWYDDTDEETFRPWTKSLPVSPSDGMFLVKGKLTLRDGTIHDGFVTPAFDDGDLGSMQPQIFIGGRRFGFWGGMFGFDEEEKQSFYKAAEKGPKAIFPISFATVAGLASGVCSGKIDGFYKCPEDKVVVET